MKHHPELWVRFIVPITYNGVQSVFGMDAMGTARSSPPFSASSRSPFRVPDFCDVSPWTRRMLFLRAERVVGFGCCQTHGCTAERLRRGGAVRAGRSRRLRRTCVCGAGSTRIHQTGMEKPAIGAAATERWSGRGPGLRHCVGPLTASELIPVPKGAQVSGECFTANPDGARVV